MKEIKKVFIITAVQILKRIIEKNLKKCSYTDYKEFSKRAPDKIPKGNQDEISIGINKSFQKSIFDEIDPKKLPKLFSNKLPKESPKALLNEFPKKKKCLSRRQQLPNPKGIASEGLTEVNFQRNHQRNLQRNCCRKSEIIAVSIHTGFA